MKVAAKTNGPVDEDLGTDKSLKEDGIESIAPLLRYDDMVSSPSIPASSAPRKTATMRSETGNRNILSRITAAGWVDYLMSMKQEAEAKRRSRAIDRSIMKDESRLHRERRFITLGAESGTEILQTMKKVQAQQTGNTNDMILDVERSIVELRFPISGGFTAHLFTLPQGIYRRERKHWIHLAERVTGVLFVVDLDIYCDVLLEDPHVNHMQEFIMLFDSIVNSRFFTKAIPILIFNHIERFKAKLERYPFKNYFPEYSGGGNDVDAAVEYLISRFNQVVRDSWRGRIPGYRISSEEEVMFRQVVKAIDETLLKRSGQAQGSG